jgi:hypothetical protein
MRGQTRWSKIPRLLGRWGGGVVALGVATAVLPLLLPAGTGTAAGADPVVRRAVLGTIVSSNKVEIATEPGAWRPVESGSPVLERIDIRTGSESNATLTLGKHGVLGLRANSHIRIGAVEGETVKIWLEGHKGELAFQLSTTTRVQLATDSTLVAGPAGGTAKPDEGPIQGTIVKDGTNTVVSLLKGSLQVRNRDAATFASLAGGHQATVTGPTRTPQITPMAEAARKKTERRLGALGFLTSGKGMALAGAAAAGGGVGVAAGVGAFSGKKKGHTKPCRGREGSGFRPCAKDK